MRRTDLLALVALGLVGCPDDPAKPTNPTTLWIGLDGSELQVKLVDQEPKPY